MGVSCSSTVVVMINDKFQLATTAVMSNNLKPALVLINTLIELQNARKY